jgi:3'-phosphoadenosine 5'-phosphosulfate sulfotransferase (PAPS reductase)/FAD synthetase
MSGLFPEPPFDPVEDARRILEGAIAEFQPSHVFAMLSGGHDSLCAAHLASRCSQFSGAVHIHTGIGILETRRHAYEAALRHMWAFRLYRPMKGNRYHELVVAHGFPGPFHHRKMYNRLKERSIRRLINDHRVGKERILLVTGVRRAESKRRMGSLSETDREGRRVWETEHKWAYMKANGIAENPVTQLLCMSGECLCGAFASPGELNEIRMWYPKAAAEIDRLAEKCREAGVHAKWGERPPAKADPAQLDIGPTGGLCWSCDARRGAA